MQQRPQRRDESILVENLFEGVVLYDTLTSEGHALDPSAAKVWNAADGTRTAAEIAAYVDIDLADATAALAELEARGLVTAGVEVSRRAMLRRSAALGVAAIGAAPFIETVVIPTAAAHASVRRSASRSFTCCHFTGSIGDCVAAVPTGCLGAGSYFIAHGSKYKTYFTPMVASFYSAAIVTNALGQTVLRLKNELFATNSTPAYHYTISGQDGTGATISKNLGGGAGSSIDILYGPLLKLALSWVPSA